MHHIAIISMKGGTGRTTLAANLGRLMADRGRVLLVDLDSQNALGLHFGMPVGEAMGISTPELDHERLATFLRANPSTVPYVPFGRPTPSMLAALTSQLRLDSSWLSRRLQQLVPSSCEYVIFDTPAARGPWLSQALALAQVVIVVFEACPMSYAALPEIENLLDDESSQSPSLRARFFVLNRVDGRRALSRDIREAFANAVGSSLLDVSIEDDEHVREATANRNTCIDYAPHSMFAASLRAVADAVAGALK